MLDKVNFRLQLWRRPADPVDDYRSRVCVLALVHALVTIDVAILEADRAYARPLIPPIYESGVIYKDPGTIEWRDIDEVRARGGADCKSLVAWRIAELRMAGWRVRPWLKWWPGDTTYHVQVLYEDSDTLEDPSAVLGMV